jgi:hypothetical protein
VPPAGKGCGVFFRVIQGARRVGIPVQGVHKKDTADNRFNIADAFYQAGDFQPGFPRKGDKMEGIAYTEKFPEERPDKVFAGFLVETAHAGRGIQEDHEIHGAACLAYRPKNDPHAE